MHKSARFANNKAKSAFRNLQDLLRPAHDRHLDFPALPGLLQAWRGPPLTVAPPPHHHFGLGHCSRALFYILKLPKPSFSGQNPFYMPICQLGQVPMINCSMQDCIGHSLSSQRAADLTAPACCARHPELLLVVALSPLKCLGFRSLF